MTGDCYKRIAIIFFGLLSLAGNWVRGQDVSREIEVDLAYDLHFYDNDIDMGGYQTASEGGFSRARLTGEFDIDELIATKMAMEVSEGGDDPEVKDLYAEFTLTENGELTLGRKKITGGMDQSLSKMDQYLLERSLANNVFGLSRHNVFEIRKKSHRWDAYASLFQDDDLDEGAKKGGALKIIFTPFVRENRLTGALGVGGNYAVPVFSYIAQEVSENILAAAPGGYKFKSRDMRLDHFSTASIDGGVLAGRWLVQGEYFSRRETATGGIQHRSTGYYWLLSRTLGGVVREYQGDSFETDRSKDLGVELVIRLSGVTLRAQDFHASAEVLSAGVNLYLNKRSKFALQYEVGEWESRDGEVSDRLPKTDVLSIRLQYTY